MRILLMAPQPFYIERGTPIAVKLLARALCSAGHTVDLLTYHEGEDVRRNFRTSLKQLRLDRTACAESHPATGRWKSGTAPILANRTQNPITPCHIRPSPTSRSRRTVSSQQQALTQPSDYGPLGPAKSLNRC